MEDDIGGGLDKCMVHDDKGLIGFLMEYFSHRRDQKAKKGLVGINVIEVQKDRA